MFALPVADTARRITDHILAHDYSLSDVDGKPTTWGWWGPEKLAREPDERALNSLQWLSFLKTAHHLTGDARYEKEYRKAAFEFHYADWITRLNEFRLELNYSDAGCQMPDAGIRYPVSGIRLITCSTAAAFHPPTSRPSPRTALPCARPTAPVFLTVHRRQPLPLLALAVRRLTWGATTFSAVFLERHGIPARFFVKPAPRQPDVGSAPSAQRPFSHNLREPESVRLSGIPSRGGPPPPSRPPASPPSGRIRGAQPASQTKAHPSIKLATTLRSTRSATAS